MRKQDFRSAFLFVAPFVLLLTAFQSKAQGWTVSFGQSGGGPYEAEGNYITGLHPFPGTNEFWALNNSPLLYENYIFGYWDWPQGAHYGGNNNFGSENPLFHHFARHSVMLADQTIIVLEENMPADTSLRILGLSRFHPNALPYPDNNYVLDWHKNIFGLDLADCYANSLIALSDGSLLVLATLQTQADPGNRNVMLLKTDANGSVLWTQIYTTPDDDYGAQVVAAADGGYFILKNLQPQSNPAQREMHLTKVDATGNVEWDAGLSGSFPDKASDMTITQDGNLAITGTRYAPGANVLLMKVSTSGLVLWRQDFDMPGRSVVGRRIVEEQNGDLVIAGNHLDSTNLQNQQILLMKTDAAGAPLWERRIGSTKSIREANVLVKAGNGGYLIGGVSNLTVWPLAYIVKTDINGIINAGLIKGNVAHDLDENCANSTSDTPLQNWVVTATRDTVTYYATTDVDGNYRIPCDTGDYVVRLIPPVNYWNPCVQDVPIHLSYIDTAQVDFPVQNTVDCPYLTVEHSSGIVRPCGSTVLTVHYCNYGPVTAENPYFTITLDSVYTFLSADAAPIDQQGNTLTFPLDDLASGDCADFNITTSVACDAMLGLAACSEVHIYPDSSCLPTNSAWSGALIRIENACDGDTVRFQLINQTSHAMPAALDYIIIEDAVLMIREESYQLGPFGQEDIILPANGSIYHMIAQQEPYAPGNGMNISAVEGCVGSNPTSNITTGLLNTYPLNDSEPYLSSYCPVVRNSYDPNIKEAAPTGFGPEHFIYKNADLEYTIHFQNTGNDTAFRVILLDTLSSFLDPTTIQPGASSHPYKYQLEGNGVLRFTFQPIALPDSTTNAEGSQGYVTFRIRQKHDNPAGTVIENNADIYFDFNAPVRTNTVFHTVKEPPFEIITTTVTTDDVRMYVQTYPNPFSEQLKIQLEGNTGPEATFRMYNATGQLVRSLTLQNNQAVLQRDGLETGMYFFTVEMGGKLVGSGKIVVN